MEDMLLNVKSLWEARKQFLLDIALAGRLDASARKRETSSFGTDSCGRRNDQLFCQAFRSIVGLAQLIRWRAL